MQSGFQFQVLYRDDHLIKVRVSVWNGGFGGEADVYVGTNLLAEIARELCGFPRNVADSREVMLGGFGSEWAGGGASMRFYCVDQSGHACVDVKIESGRDLLGRIQSATFSVPIEAGALDSFVDQLHSMVTGAATTACLRAAVSGLAHP
jgi:hypothetical protein